jgi:hypothetical protein
MSTQLIKFSIKKDNDKELYIDILKNINRLNSVIINQCGNRCFSNIQSDKLDKSENECISICIKKYYNSLQIGDMIYELFNNKDLNTTDLLKGRYESIVNRINSNILN